MEIVVPAEFQYLYTVDADHPILKIPDDRLRQVARPIVKVSKRHKVLAANMIKIMRDAHGVGLAGPQIGVLERIVVICPDEKPIVLINPVIEEQSGSQKDEEGCLSIPALYGHVERSDSVVVSALDIKGNAVRYEMTGYAARVIQHEVDHLDGILFIDKVDSATLTWHPPAKDR